MPSSGNHTAVSAFDDDLRKGDATAQLDNSTFTSNFFANFRRRNVADAHFKRHTSFEGIGADDGNGANDVDYGGDTTAVKCPITAQ